MSPTSLRLSGICCGLGVGAFLHSEWGPAAPVALFVPLFVYTCGRLIGEAVRKARNDG